MMRWESRKTAEGLAVNRERDACICNGPKANKSSGITPIDIPCECRWIVIIQFRRGPEAHFVHCIVRGSRELDRPQRLAVSYRVLTPIALTALAFLPASAAAERIETPLRFFEGRTEMASVVKVALKRPYRSVTIGSGRILSDGSLVLVQSVREEGKSPRTRYWKIQQTSNGHYVGTMSDAVGPIDVQEIEGNYRFRFKMKGNLAVEQWLNPLPGGRSARSTVTVRKFGMRVATSSGTIRRV